MTQWGEETVDHVLELDLSVSSVGARTTSDTEDGDDLRAAAARWRIAPVQAFEAWKQSQRVHGTEFDEHSIEQYRSMWRRHCSWLSQAGLSLHTVDAHDIECFLASLRGGRLAHKPVAASTKRRYLFLLHRTYAHLALLGVIKRNPVAELPELARHQASERPARTLLRQDQEQAYIDWCMAQPAERWDQIRNRALRLLFLASGITVAEARMLTVNDVAVLDEDPINGFAALVLPAHGNTPARDAPVSAFAVKPLKQWLDARYPIGGSGVSLFAAGRPYTLCSIIDPAEGHMRPADDPLSAEEIYQIVCNALRAIGFDGQRAGPSTLRNAYMARQIRHGHPLDRIRDWVGLRTTEQLRALQRQVPRRMDGIAPI